MILSRARRHRIEQIARGRGDGSLHLLEGPKAVRDALEEGVVAELWIRRDLEAPLREELREAARRQDVPVGEGTRAEFDRLTRTTTPQGVLALVRDTARPLREVLGREGLLLWLDGVQDPGNVGAVVRVATGLGAAGLILSEGSADPLGLKALRASAGLALRLPFARAQPEEVAEACSALGVPVWVLDRGGDDVREVTEVPTHLVLVVGAEGPGVGAAARRVATRCVGVPLAPGVDSLNAAVAAGIAVAQLVRGAP
jgi:tRNA G18 (ribose-2'-O)-methylase SpoU